MPRTFYKRLFDISEKRILIFMVSYFLIQNPVALILSFCFEFHMCNYWVFVICVIITDTKLFINWSRPRATRWSRLDNLYQNSKNGFGNNGYLLVAGFWSEKNRPLVTVQKMCLIVIFGLGNSRWSMSQVQLARSTNRV